MLSREEFASISLSAACDTSTPISAAQAAVDDMVDTIETLARYINFDHANNVTELEEFEDLTLLLRERGWIE